MKQASIIPKFVDFIPDQLTDGILYVSDKYKIVAHKCCCGCGEEVITPLSPADWQLYKNKNGVSLSPSIGNWNFRCRSHYWIRGNQIIWASSMSEKKIAYVQERDRLDKQRYIASLNSNKDGGSKKHSLLHQAWIWLRNLWEHYFK